MDLHEALAQISVIRRTLARDQVFRGYGAQPVAVSSALAVVGAVVQAVVTPRPEAALNQYLTLWIGLATLGLSVSLVDVWFRYRHSPLSLWKEDAWLACQQFLPTVLAGAMLTAVIVVAADDVVWMLPGLWSVLFGLGVFASSRMLPPAILWVGAWYVVAGSWSLATFQGAWALSPWAMVLTFGVGQFAAACVLHAWHRQLDEAPAELPYDAEEGEHGPST